MRTPDLKSLANTISSVVDPTDDRTKMLAEGYINSLTEKARQVFTESEKEEKNEKPDDMEDIIKRLAAKALKRAKKKARRPSGDDAYAGKNPAAAKSDPDMKNAGAIAEVAAPGYEKWASDPKVKSAFKKRYGERWKGVMYGHSWNMKKMDEEVSLAEGIKAKRMRLLRKGKPLKPEVKDWMDRSFKKQNYRNRLLGANVTGGKRKDLAHMDPPWTRHDRNVSESVELLEAGYKKLMRLKKSAYNKSLKARTGDPAAQDKFAKTKRAEAEQESKVATRMAMKGGASADAVRGGGNRRGKRGGFTAQAGKLANKREEGIRNFRNLNVDRGVARDTEIGTVQAVTNRVTGKKPKMTQAQVARKRESQAKMREFGAKVRSGTFGRPEDPEAAAFRLRPRYNYLKRTGQLKTKGK